MTRQEAKELLPIMQAFAEGKHIEVRVGNSDWKETDEVYGGRNNDYTYRIKSEPKYREFTNNKECWQEMLKHKPFGWVKKKNVENSYNIIDGVYYSENYDCPVTSMSGEVFSYKELIDNYLFADGTPVGIKQQ